MVCEHCDIGDGTCAYPHYGVAPHECYFRLGKQIGRSKFLSKSDWPENFTPDAETNNECGIYRFCPYCNAGKEEAERLDSEIEKARGRG